MKSLEKSQIMPPSLAIYPHTGCTQSFFTEAFRIKHVECELREHPACFCCLISMDMSPIGTRFNVSTVSLYRHTDPIARRKLAATEPHSRYNDQLSG